VATPAVTAALLRDLMRQVTAEMPGAPAQPLRVGEVLGGRVSISPEGARMLVVDGVRIAAQLPGDVPTGVPLKFQVTESSPEKLVLQVLKTAATAGPEAAGPLGQAQQTQQTQAAAQAGPLAATPWAALQMPGGAQARMWLDPDGASDTDSIAATRERSRSMVVRYDSQVLGRMDVVLRLEADKLEATVLGQAGEPIARMRASASELRAALMAATERPVALSTGGRTAEVINVSA
jgi:hypothetical protein